jgi:hypothetical protein
MVPFRLPPQRARGDEGDEIRHLSRLHRAADPDTAK